jgi:hypothetical protein
MPDGNYLHPYPPLTRGGAQVPQRDWMTYAGAHALADMIREAWARCGRDVRPTVVHIANQPRKGAVYVVKLPPEVASGVWRP